MQGMSSISTAQAASAAGLVETAPNAQTHGEFKSPNLGPQNGPRHHSGGDNVAPRRQRPSPWPQRKDLGTS